MANPYAAPKSDAARDEREPETHPVAGEPPPKPRIARDDEFVQLCEPGDPFEASLIAQSLEAEGIATTGASQLTGAMIGVGQSLMPTPVFVPKRELERARE